MGLASELWFHCLSFLRVGTPVFLATADTPSSSGYSFLLRQVCSEWRTEIPPVSAASWAYTLFGDGQLSLIKQYQIPPQPRFLKESCYRGQQAVLQHFLPQVEPFIHDESGAIYYSSWGGQFSTVQWLRRQGAPWCNTAVPCFARVGNREAILWALAEGAPREEAMTVMWAVERSDPDLLLWLEGQGFPLIENIYDVAANMADTAMLEWAFQNNVPFDEDTTHDMMSIVTTPVLEWFHEKELLQGSGLAVSASQSDNLEALLWLRDHQYPYDEERIKEEAGERVWGWFTSHSEEEQES